jgi:hypothetical protein
MQKISDFEEAFRDSGLRVELAWERLRAPEFSVSHTVSRSARLLGAMFTVWYEDLLGKDGAWDRPGRPLRVREVMRTKDDWPADRGRRVSSFHNAFAVASEPAQLVLPTYALPGGELLILDGSHRAVAAHRAAVPVRLLIYTLRGPVEEGVLPDLRHHTAPVPPSGPGTARDTAPG